MSAKTNRTVARHATTRAESGNFTVLGVFGAETDMRALVRDRGGRVEKVAPGDRISEGRVLAIDAGGIMVERWGKSERIPVAGG